MKVFQIEGQLDRIFFSNFERVDESIIFDMVLEKLKNNKNVIIGKKIIGPSEDLYNCKMDDSEFSIIFDLDEGVSIFSKNTSITDKIKRIFNY